MKVVLDRTLLERALNKAKEATEKKASLPVLNNLLLSAEGENLVLKATDLENYLTLSIPATIIEEGKVCVHSKKLTDIVKNGNCSEVIFSLNGSNLVVECGRSKFKLATADIEEFPEFPSPEEIKGETTLQAQLLLEAIDRTDYAISKEAENVAFCGMFVGGKENKVHFVGTDGHRLALYTVPLNSNLSVILPKKTLKVLKKLLDPFEELKLKTADNFAFLEGNSWSLAVRLVEAEFPDYEAVIPQETPISVEVGTEELLKALKRVSLLMEGKVKPVRLNLKKGLMVISAENPDFGSAEETLEVENYEELSVEVNAKYLIEALDNFDSEKVVLGFQSEEHPIMIKPTTSEPYLCLIMPMVV